MNAIRLPRLGSWRGVSAEAATAAPDASELVARQTLAAAGDFLFAHGASLTPVNLDIALRHAGGSDPALSAAIAALVAMPGGVTDVTLAKFAATNADAVSPERIDALADRLQERLNECLALIDRSSASARDYGEAFDAGVARLDAGQAGAIAELRDLTHALVATTHDMHREMTRARRETERLRCELKQTRREAERDHLTDLPNRRFFAARAAEAAAAGGDGVQIALCDIDGFKGINDEFGHATGDRVLRFIAAHLSRELRRSALVARYGGEEFALLFADMAAEDVHQAIDEARARLAARTLIDQDSGRPLPRITFSAGVAPLGNDPAQGLEAADRALYAAKRAGKDRVAFGGD